MRKVRLSAAARRDLSDIWMYSARRWDRAQADRYIRSLAASFDRLAGDPASGRSIDAVRPGYSKLAVGSHVIFYRLAATDQIEVMRILHQRMDVDRHL